MIHLRRFHLISVLYTLRLNAYLAFPIVHVTVLFGDKMYVNSLPHLRSGDPWYHVEWRDHPGGNTWEFVKNLSGEDGIALVRSYEDHRKKEAAKFLRAKVGDFDCDIFLTTNLH